MKLRPLHRRLVAIRRKRNMRNADRFLRFAYGVNWREHVARLWTADNKPLLDSEL